MRGTKGGGSIPSAQRVFAIAAGYLSSMNLKRAMRAGVFHLLASGAMSAADVASRTGLAARDAMDLLDTLVALGLLVRRGAEYANTEESACYLDPESPAYAGAMLVTMRPAA